MTATAAESPTAAQEPARIAPSGALGCSDDRYACASKAYRAGDLEGARAAVGALLRDRPDDADALLLSGLIALRQGELDVARAALDHAASIAPGYADIFSARARLNLRQGRLEAAREDIALVLALSPSHADGAALRSGLAGAVAGGDPGGKPRWTAALDHSVSRLSARAADAWYETQATFVRSQGRTSFALEVEHARRFARSDVRFQLRSDHRIGAGSVYGAVLATVAPDFRETWGLRAGGSCPLSRRIDILVDGRFSNYGRVSSGSMTTAVRAWSADRHTAVRLGLINFIDEAGSYRAGLSVDLSQLISSRLRVQAGYAEYPETEAGITRRIKSAFAGGTYQVRDTLGVRFGIERETRENAYRRDSATVGLSVGF